MSTRNEDLLKAILNDEDVSDWDCKTENEVFLKSCATGSECDSVPKTRNQQLLKQLAHKIATQVVPEGTIQLTQNGVAVDVTNYATANVNVEIDNDTLSDLIQITGGKNLMYNSNVTNEQLNQFNLSRFHFTDLSSAFNSCNNITTIPSLSFPSVTRAVDMFSDCKKLATLQLDMPNVTVINSAFMGCTLLDNVELNAPKAEVCNSLFSGCSNLKTVNLHIGNDCSSSSGIYAQYMFSRCSSLEQLPDLDYDKIGNASYMFNGCTNLKTDIDLDFGKAITLYYLFCGCSNLENIKLRNANKWTLTTTNMLYGCCNLKSVIIPGIVVSFDISASIKFTEQNLVETINNLGKVYSTQTLTMGVTNLAKLTNEEIAIATDKGWTLA